MVFAAAHIYLITKIGSRFLYLELDGKLKNECLYN